MPRGASISAEASRRDEFGRQRGVNAQGEGKGEGKSEDNEDEEEEEERFVPRFLTD